MSSALELEKHLRQELCTIPLQSWGHFFPCFVAMWRFLRESRPDLFDEINCSYDEKEGPTFRGKGADLFGKIMNSDAIIDCCENIMYPLASGLTLNAKARGFLKSTEVPSLDQSVVEDLADVILKSIG